MQVGDIFYFNVAYDDDPSEFKNRPVIVVDDIDGNLLLLVTTTSKGRKTPVKGFDRYKIPINNWRKSGFKNPSWCRGMRLIEVTQEEINANSTQKDYIGRMNADDFNFIVEELEKMHCNPQSYKPRI